MLNTAYGSADASYTRALSFEFQAVSRKVGQVNEVINFARDRLNDDMPLGPDGADGEVLDHVERVDALFSAAVALLYDILTQLELADRHFNQEREDDAEQA